MRGTQCRRKVVRGPQPAATANIAVKARMTVADHENDPNQQRATATGQRQCETFHYMLYIFYFIPAAGRCGSVAQKRKAEM